MQELKDYSGTLTKLKLVNPHSYLYFNTIGADGKPLEMRCEMRAATLIRRSGWKSDGSWPAARRDPRAPASRRPALLLSREHRDRRHHDHRPQRSIHACARRHLAAPAAFAVGRAEHLRRLGRRAGGAHDSAGGRQRLARAAQPARGLRGRQDHARADSRAQSCALAPEIHGEGQGAATAFRMWSTEDNPRLSCKPTSIVFDWTFDWPVNRVTQTTVDGKKVIDIDYGLFSATRRVHFGIDSHPAGLTPSNSGHSIGRWDGDTLVVDTVGFAEGVLVPPTRNSPQLHVVERYTLDPQTFALKREYTAEDPVYLAAPYTGQDTVLLSEVPYEKQRCAELTFEFTQPGN